MTSDLQMECWGIRMVYKGKEPMLSYQVFDTRAEAAGIAKLMRERDSRLKNVRAIRLIARPAVPL
jgi:hypothetical protein